MQKWRIGDVTITKVVEIEVTGGTRFILPDATYDACRPITWMHPHFMDGEGRLKMSVHALVVETPSRRIVVDTCWVSGGVCISTSTPGDPVKNMAPLPRMPSVISTLPQNMVLLAY